MILEAKQNIFGITVGQTIWYKSLSGIRGDDTTLKESKVLNVGKKYFELEDKYVGRFFIHNLKHDSGNYSPRYQIYLNKEQYNEEVESHLIHSKLRNIFTSYNSTLELSKLRKILLIIES